MSKNSKIQYNPSLTVKENAKSNGVTEAAIRYYIKVNHLDRRFDRKQNIIDDCRKYLKKHPSATKTELHKKTGHSLSTIYQYWEYISTEKELILEHKKKKFHPNITFRHSSVYLMKEKSSSHIKIGKAVQPLKREKTLQSEKPDITLFLICPCENEEHANEFEKYLHKLFRNKRVRGEWFDLNEDDINMLTSKYQWMDTENFKNFIKDNNEIHTDNGKEEYVIAVKNGLPEYQETRLLCERLIEKIKSGRIKQYEVSNINNFLKDYI